MYNIIISINFKLSSIRHCMYNVYAYVCMYDIVTYVRYETEKLLLISCN